MVGGIKMDKPKIVIQGLHQGDDLAVGVSMDCNGADFYFMLKSFIEAIANNSHPFELLLYKAMIDETIDKFLGIDERKKGADN